MKGSQIVNKIIKEISEQYKEINNIYIQESIEDNIVDIIIDNKIVFDSFSYAKYIFDNTIEDKGSGRFINFLFVNPLEEKEYIKTLECVFTRYTGLVDLANTLIMNNNLFFKIDDLHRQNIEWEPFFDLKNNPLTMEFDMLSPQLTESITDGYIGESYKKNTSDVMDASNLFSFKQENYSWKMTQPMSEAA